MGQPKQLTQLLTDSQSKSPQREMNLGGRQISYSDIGEYDAIVAEEFSDLLPLSVEEKKMITRHCHSDMGVSVLCVELARKDIVYAREGAKKRAEYMKRLYRADTSEGTSDWFLAQLQNRSQMKRPIKLTKYTERAEEFLVAAYRRRVANDCKAFVADKNFAEQVSFVSKWMIGEIPNNGLILRGDVGVGKSTMMRSIMDVYAIVEKRRIREVSANDIAIAGVSDKRTFNELCEEQMLAIDDLGTEPPCIKSFGNEISPMVDMITERHRRLRFTLITTNLSVEQLTERYGKRVLDRLHELCTMSKYSGDIKSYR